MLTHFNSMIIKTHLISLWGVLKMVSGRGGVTVKLGAFSGRGGAGRASLVWMLLHKISGYKMFCKICMFSSTSENGICMHYCYCGQHWTSETSAHFELEADRTINFLCKLASMSVVIWNRQFFGKVCDRLFEQVWCKPLSPKDSSLLWSHLSLGISRPLCTAA